MWSRLAPFTLLALAACGSSTDVEVAVEARGMDRPTVDRVIDEFRNVCRPLFNRHRDDVRRIRALVSDEPSTQTRRFGWGTHVEIVVDLGWSRSSLPKDSEGSARFLLGGGARPGVLAFTPTAAALCDQPLAPGRSQAFLPAPGLGDYLGKLVLNPTTDQVRMWREEVARAMTGDYQSQRNVAWCYIDGCYGVEPIDDAKACVWRLVIQAAKHPKSDASDTQNVEVDCRQALAPEDLAAAGVAARDLFRKIYKREMP